MEFEPFSNNTEEENSHSGLSHDFIVVSKILSKRNEQKSKSWFGGKSNKKEEEEIPPKHNPFQLINEILEKRNAKKKRSWFGEDKISS